MNIKPGPKLQAFADRFGCDIIEVVDWVNRYVNRYKLPDGMQVEPDEKSRLKSIQEYIQFRLDESLTEQVKASLIGERISNSEVNEVHSCPF
jgi:hypothetical protein